MKKTGNKTKRIKTLEIGSSVKTMREAIASDGETIIHIAGTDVYFAPTQDQAQKFWADSQKYAQTD